MRKKSIITVFAVLLLISVGTIVTLTNEKEAEIHKLDLPPRAQWENN